MDGTRQDLVWSENFAQVGEMKAQNIFDSVVIASESDFGRTLSSNGAGTDHAWAGNHFVLGGKVNGGRVYNDFPSSLHSAL